MKRTHLALMAAPLALSACVAGPVPRIETPRPALPDTFLFARQAEDGAALAALLPTDDAAFTTLAGLALNDAPTLSEALARVEAARAGAARAGANRLPSIGADASVTASRTNPAQFAASLPPGIGIDTERTAYAANVTARWDPDLFGVLKASERAALARVDAADAQAQAVRLALIAEIAATVIDYRSVEARGYTLSQDMEAATAIARLAADREQAGLAPGFDRIRAEATAATTRSRLAALGSEKARLFGRLVTLTGAQPALVKQAFVSHTPVTSAPAAPATLPSQLLANRPDVRGAEANLAASDAELAATARQRFPKLTLSAAIGLLAFSPGDLFDEDSIVGSLAAGLAAPLLDFGRIEAEIDGAAANKRAAFAAYRGAVFTALGDAETAYGLVAAADAELAAANLETAQLERAADLAETRYRAGLADFLTVLDARRAADGSTERAVAAAGRARRARVLLWQALGGSDLSPLTPQS